MPVMSRGGKAGKLAYRLQAFATRFLKLGQIEQLDLAARVLDDSIAFEHAECQRNGRAMRTKHLPKKFVRQGQAVCLNAVAYCKQPSRQSLFERVESVARRTLRIEPER